MKNSELKNKHNHALTQWLKVGIFSLLMLAPLIASVSQWLYAVCNKNAKDSWKVNYVSESVDTLIQGRQYYINIPERLHSGESFDLFFEHESISGLETTITPTTSEYYRTQLSGDSSYYYLSVGNQIYTNFYGSFYFVYDEGDYTDLLPYIKIYYQETLDNAFYYGVDQMTKSDLFNWTQNTALYTGIKGMTDNLEIGTPAIAILITYWTILTIAYVIIDILITGFTWITHLIVRND